MIHIEELKPMILYKKQVHLPINDKEKTKGSVVFLLTPSIQSSINTMNHPLLINKYHLGYYIEKDITYFINNESMFIPVDSEVIMEGLRADPPTRDEYKITDNILTVNTESGTFVIIFNDSLENEIIKEGSIEHNASLKRILYEERYRTPKEVFLVHDSIKAGVPKIKYTYIDYNRYKSLNIFVDFFYYNELFFKNNMFKLDKGVDLYFDFITRFLKDKRLTEHGYTKKHILIPVVEWANAASDKKEFINYTNSINPISMINRLIKTNYQKLRDEWKDIVFVFIGNGAYFKLDFAEYDEKVYTKFMQYINNLSNPAFVLKEDPTVEGESKKSIITNIVAKIEKGTGITINNLTGSEDATEAELMKRIEKAAMSSKDTEEAIDTLDEDPALKMLLKDAMEADKTSPSMNASRTKRMDALATDYYNIKVGKTPIRDIIDNSNKVKEIPTTVLDIDSINDEWKNLKFVNFEKHFDVKADILASANSFNEGKSLPVAVRNVIIEDTSTSEDYIDTYTFEMEDSFGKRFSVKLDIPKLKDDKVMILRGNEKTLNKQSFLHPIVKTDEDTVQIVSNYNKVFIYRFGTKSYVVADKMIKFLEKMEESKDNSFKLSRGDCTRANSKFQIPMDYADMAQYYTSIETSDVIIYFNQKVIQEKYNDIYKEQKDMYPVGYSKRFKKIIYVPYKQVFSAWLYSVLIAENADYEKRFDELPTSKKYMYSRASIMNSKIPLIVVLSYSEGLFTVMKKADIQFEVYDKRPTYDKLSQDMIKFNDGFIVYDLNYESSLLMNGIKECNTQDYSIKDVDSKAMWLDFLDIFGNRILADGIENFYECMIDKPATYEVLEDLHLPTEYTKVMIYGNNLLADTGYTPHTSMSDKRMRSNEIISAYAYKVLADGYGDYRKQVKNGRKDATISVKRTAVIDSILELSTVSDLSTINVINEAETLSAISAKGLSGMNADRAFGLDKRGFDISMINIMGMSTIMAAGAGINRQCTIDSDISGKRGYINSNTSTDAMSITKTFTFSEALTPFGNRDDFSRASMKYSQDKHGMRVARSSPLLVTNGVDEALPYMITNTFVFKTAEAGEVIEKTADCMIIKYKSGKTEFVDLRSNVKKNSGGGFYIPLRLVTDLKVGSKFKENDVIAYDPLSFSPEVGHKNNVGYSVGTFVKVGILNTDEGYEDSCIIDHYLSEAMAAEVIIQKTVSVGPNANILSMVTPGTPIEEGNSLMIFQNSFDEADINTLLKTLAADDEDISDLGRIPIKSKITGIVEAIKGYRTVELEELSPSLRKKFNELEKDIKNIKSIMKKYDVEHASRFGEADYKLDKAGKLKDVDGVLFEFYLRYSDKMAIGDKLTFFVALKGIVKDIFEEGLEPFTDFRPTERINAFVALGSVDARMTASILPHGYINKTLVELVRNVRDIINIPYDVKNDVL